MRLKIAFQSSSLFKAIVRTCKEDFGGAGVKIKA
jgi:hypothetical protein